MARPRLLPPAPVRRRIRLCDAQRPSAGQRPVHAEPLLRRAPHAGEFFGPALGFIDESLASLGRKRKVVLTVNQFFTAGRVVANSDLLTVLPRHFVVYRHRRATGAPGPALPGGAGARRGGVAQPPEHQRSAHVWLRHALLRARRDKAFPASDARP